MEHLQCVGDATHTRHITYGSIEFYLYIIINNAYENCKKKRNKKHEKPLKLRHCRQAKV